MKILNQQALHGIALLVLLFGLYVLYDARFKQGEALGLGSHAWFLLSILIPILHQTFVAIVWRAEIHYKLMTKKFGGKALSVFGFVFLPLLGSRLLSVTILAISNRNTIGINSRLSIFLAVIILALAGYTFHCVILYFGIRRALGADHFYDSYRNKPFEKRGIHKYVSNAMYVFAIGILWVPGLFFQSRAALGAALFSHLYIWVHYFTVEKPDMKIIYGNKK